MEFFQKTVFHFQTLIVIGAYAQQFEGTLRGIGYPGLSDDCLLALNTTIKDCPVLLSEAALNNPRLGSEQLTELCTSSCHSSLTSARHTISAGCKAPNDTIEFDSVVYPATYIIDRFSYTYDLSCRKDKSSGRYCDEEMFSWLIAGNESTKAANCSDCALGVVQTQLNSPFGFDEEFAQDFQALTSSCGLAGYSFTTPAAYAVRTNSPDRAEDANAASCSRPYVVKSGDSCDAIALAHQISTFSIIKAGGLRSDCSDLLPGASLCLPAPCTLYRVKEGDDCTSIISAHSGLTGFSFLSWNPNITPLCNNLGELATNLICVSPPGGNTADITITVTPPTSSTVESIAVPRPTNGKDDTTAACANWYTVQDGDFCESISIRQNIALRDFYYLNPSIDKDCTNLWLDTAYCVQAVGDINTYPSYPYSSSAIYTLTSSSYMTTSSVFVPIQPVATPLVLLPLAPGTKADCEGYVEYIPVQPFQNQAESENVRLLTERVNSCDFASSGYAILFDDFLKWNPSLTFINPCYLQPSFRYCAVDRISSYDGIPSYGSCRYIDEPYPGTIDTCECFTLITATGTKNPSCAKIASDAGITISDLSRWNPWVGSSCDDGLFKDLALKQQRPVCITASSGGSLPTTTRVVTTTSSSGTTPTGVTPPAPTQSGIATSCAKYYKAVLGDGCWAIANDNNITLDQFYAWNPAVGNDCVNLWPEYAYCVAA